MSYPACIRVRHHGVSGDNAVYALPLSSVKTWHSLQKSLGELFPTESRPFSVTVGSSKDAIHPNVWHLFVTSTLLIDVEASRNKKLTLYVTTSQGDQVAFHVSRSTLLASIVSAYTTRVEKKPCELVFLYDGARLPKGATVASLGLQDGESIEVHVEQKGGKPVITCYPLMTTDLEVGLSLSEGLDFSYVYPLPRGALVSDIGAARKVLWKVTAKPNGELIDVETKCAYAQLFWEATQLQGKSTRPTPIDTSMTDSSRVLMTTPDLFPTFMDDLMFHLGFQVKERQEFVTYWGPQLLENPLILVKLLTPEEYDSAAALSVSPRPDRVVRLFVIFRGVTVSEMEAEGLSAAAVMDSEVALLLGGRPVPQVGSGEDGFVVFEWGGMIA